MKIGTWNRRTAGSFVLLAWAAALAWLARRELGKNEAEQIAEATIRLSPEAHFFAVKAAGQQVGYASVTVDTFPIGFRLSEVMALDVPEGDSTRRVTRRADLVLTRSLRLASFVRTVTGNGLYEEFSGKVEGDTLLRMGQRDSRDAPIDQWTIRIPGDVVLPEVLPYRLAFGKRLEVGRAVAANVLDLATGTVNRIEFTATAESTFVVADSAREGPGHRWVAAAFDTIKAYRIEHTAAGTPMVTWVDEHGGLVHSEAALGVRMDRSAFELVSFNYKNALERSGPEGHRTIGGMTTLVEAGLRPDAKGGNYQIQSSPIEHFLLPRLAWLAGGRQAALQGEVRIGKPGDRRADSTKSEYLDPAPIARGVPAEVAVTAAQLVAGIAAPADKVTRLLAYTAGEVKLDRSNAASWSPARVLAEHRAGAEGKAALFVDLARAQGLESRMVGGVAVIGGRLYGHTWAEVRLGGGWVAVDPTFRSFPAAPSLVRIGVGMTGRAIDLVPLIGSASFRPIQPGTTR